MRKLSGLIMLLLLSVVLVSCSVGEDDEPEATEAPTSPPISTRITEATVDADVGMPGTPSFDIVEDATPTLRAEASPAAGLGATPASESAVVAGASPVATPQVASSPVATPAMSGMIVPPPAEPTATPMMIALNGTIVLNGNENEAFVLTDEGCVGLGEHAGLHEGRQVVIRNESGTIVSVTTLETADTDACAWEFVASVPESAFYAVSIPMEFEQVFPQAMVADANGEVTIELP